MKKILFIEDEMRLQKIMESVLNDAGYKFLMALDGEIGLKMIKEEKPDLVLLDLILPRKDGFELLAEMRENGETKNIPVIILTNLEEKFDVEKAMSYDVHIYLVKTNYQPKEIVEKINEVLK